MTCPPPCHTQRSSQWLGVESQLLGYAQYPRLSWSKAKSLTPVTVLYIANVGFALLSIQHLNIPMYNSLKRLTPVLVLIEKVRALGVLAPAPAPDPLLLNGVGVRQAGRYSIQ